MELAWVGEGHPWPLGLVPGIRFLRSVTEQPHQSTTQPAAFPRSALTILPQDPDPGRNGKGEGLTATGLPHCVPLLGRPLQQMDLPFQAAGARSGSMRPWTTPTQPTMAPNQQVKARESRCNLREIAATGIGG